MAGVDVVAAVDVLLVDGEAGAGEQLEHALEDHEDLKRMNENVTVNKIYS